MSWGRSNQQWNHTASLLLLLASIHSDPDSSQRPQLATYHPYMPEPQLPTLPPNMLPELFRQMRRGGDE